MTESLKHYIQSIAALKGGDRAGAETHLAECLGVESLPPYAKQNLDALSGDEPSELIMKLIVHDAKKEGY